jgi:hypothetical protein
LLCPLRRLHHLRELALARIQFRLALGKRVWLRLLRELLSRLAGHLRKLRLLLHRLLGRLLREPRLLGLLLRLPAGILWLLRLLPRLLRQWKLRLRRLLRRRKPLWLRRLLWLLRRGLLWESLRLLLRKLRLGLNGWEVRRRLLLRRLLLLRIACKARLRLCGLARRGGRHRKCPTLRGLPVPCNLRRGVPRPG